MHTAIPRLSSSNQLHFINLNEARVNTLHPHVTRVLSQPYASARPVSRHATKRPPTTCRKTPISITRSAQNRTSGLSLRKGGENFSFVKTQAVPVSRLEPLRTVPMCISRPHEAAKGAAQISQEVD